jgi:ubiquinone/menaquinone biosynthesis C-methylase UbiE
MKSEERFRDYAPLACFYDRYWGERYHALVLPILDRLLLHKLPPATSPLLDVCCGIGHLALGNARRPGARKKFFSR